MKILLVAFCVGCLAWPTCEAQQPAASLATNDDNILFATPTTLDRIGRIVVPVSVNGAGPFRFLLDTGANRSMLSAQLVTQLGLAPDTDQLIDVHGVTGNAHLPSIAVDRLAAGALVLSNLRLPVAQSVMGGVEGVLGVDGFDGLLLSVDFRLNRVELERSKGRRAPRGSMVVPVRLRHGRLIVVDAAVGKVRVKAVIDTGAERTLGNAVLRDALATPRIHSERTRNAYIEGISATTQRGTALDLPRVRLAKTDIADVEIVFGDFYVFRLWELEHEPALIVGMDVLGVLAKLNVDYRRRELHLFPNR